jgi:uncharacterized membrane protein
LSFQSTIELSARVLDAAGVAALAIGVGYATLLFGRDILQSRNTMETYRGYRSSIGRSILLSLEFLVAADIIRTVAIEPTFEGVGVLAIIVLIRTFLSMALELELEGRWPWQQRADPAESS